MSEKDGYSRRDEIQEWNFAEEYIPDFSDNVSSKLSVFSEKRENMSPKVKIEQVRSDVDELAETITSFTGTSNKSKEYTYIGETMFQYIMRIADIESDGSLELKAAKRELLGIIKKHLSVLEDKLSKNISDTPSLSPSEGDVDTNTTDSVSNHHQNLNIPAESTEAIKSTENDTMNDYGKVPKSDVINKVSVNINDVNIPSNVQVNKTDHNNNNKTLMRKVSSLNIDENSTNSSVHQKTKQNGKRYYKMENEEIKNKPIMFDIWKIKFKHCSFFIFMIFFIFIVLLSAHLL